jgi:hypothetical protein
MKLKMDRSTNYKEINFAYLCNSKDLNIDYQLNKQLYDNMSKNFDKFFVINLIKLVENKNTKIGLNSFPKNFIIFTPSSYFELNKYLKKLNLYAFVALGRELKYLRALYLFKKNKVKLILNFSSGVIPKANMDKIPNKKNIIFNYPKLYHLFFRLLNLINLIPPIDIVFEVNNNVKNHFDNLFLKKLGNFFGINISYFKKIIRINSRAYDDFCYKKVKLKNNYISFLDSGFDIGDRIRIEGKPTKSQRKEYYTLLKKNLMRLSQIYNKKIIINAHPKTNISVLQKYLGNFKVVKYQTKDFILKSKIVVFHESSSANWAIILKKKILCLSDEKNLGIYYEQLIKNFSKNLNIKHYCMQDIQNFKNNEIIKIINKSNKKMDNYINSTLCMNYKNFNKVIKNDKKIVKNNKNLPGYQQIIDHLKKIKRSQLFH